MPGEGRPRGLDEAKKRTSSPGLGPLGAVPVAIFLMAGLLLASSAAAAVADGTHSSTEYIVLGYDGNNDGKIGPGGPEPGTDPASGDASLAIGTGALLGLGALLWVMSRPPRPADGPKQPAEPGAEGPAPLAA